MDRYLRAPDRMKLSELSRPFCGSFLFHVLLLAVMSSNAPFYLVTGPQMQLDIVWSTSLPASSPAPLPAPASAPPPAPAPSHPHPAVSPADTTTVSVQSPAFQSPLDTAPPPEPAAPSEAEGDLEVSIAAPQQLRQGPKKALPAHPPVHSKSVHAGAPHETVPPSSHLPAAGPAKTSEMAVVSAPLPISEEQKEDAPSLQHGPIPPAQVEPAAVATVRPPTPAEVATLKIPAAENQRPPEAGNPSLVPVTAGAQPKAVPRHRKVTLSQPQLKAATEPRQALGTEAQPKAISPPESQGEPLPTKQPARLRPQVSPPPVQPGKLESAHSARGLVAAPLRGDLKLVVAGDTRIKLAVTFREYPRSRRNEAQSRSQAGRPQPVLPVLATREDTREAVIETAREGVYTFSAEPAAVKSARARFTVKIFETGTRERSVSLGTRTISGSTILLKILMPEGILWDDDSAFSGSMEDSESETKFNANTGLYWKEFHD